MALISKDKGKICIEICDSIPYTDKEKIRRYLAQPKTIVTGLKSQHVVFRTLVLPLKSTYKVLEALPFQLEAILPFSLDQAIVCPFLKAFDSSTLISLLATSKDFLIEHLNACTSLDIHPDIITCAPLALFRLARWLYPQQQDLLFFHFGESKTHCLLIQEKQLKLSQSIRMGKADLMEALKALFPHRENLNEELLTSFSFEGDVTISFFKDKLSKELERLAVFIKEKIQTELEIPWVLYGENVSSMNLEAIWKEIFGPPLSLIKPTPSITDSSNYEGRTSPSLDRYALAIGYGLDALSSDKYRIQFLQKEFTPKRHLLARKKLSWIFASVCLFLSILISVSSALILKKKTHALSDKLNSYFLSSQKAAHSLSLAEIERELLKIENMLLKQKKSFPFFLTVPKVSDVLAWISTHPAFATPEGLPKEGIEIKNLHYQLIKFPTLEDPTAPYQAQLELEFVAQSPRLAREFHEALLKGDRIVHPKKEIKWNARGNVYTIQFELNKSAST